MSRPIIGLVNVRKRVIDKLFHVSVTKGVKPSEAWQSAELTASEEWYYSNIPELSRLKLHSQVNQKIKRTVM